MGDPHLKILILGGYGVFGGRLARLLADEPALTLVIAGRSKAKATDICSELTDAATVIPALFDRDGDVVVQLRDIAPDAVVDASGPFQGYGGDPYRVVRAALHLGIHYLDLADGSEFVSGISAFDAEAKARGVFVLSGVSSFPVLTAAVVRHLAKSLESVETITAGIAPSPHAGVGLNVVKAIASYAGKPVRLTREGLPGIGYGLTESLRATIAPPGRLPLANIRFSLVDVPDLRLLPPDWPGLRSIWIGAGPVPEILHRVLNLLAWLVRLKLVPSLSVLAPLFHWAINRLHWGPDRGGMFVRVTGWMPGGKPVTRTWHLLAEGKDGPFIPSMAAEAIVRRMLSGRSPEPGARAAIHDLELADYDALFSRRTIFTGVREEADQSPVPLYQRVLGDAFAQLPEPLRQLHRGGDSYAGQAKVERGPSVISRAIGWLFGFPAAGDNIPVEVRFTRRGQTEVWRRTFGSRSFQSTQEPGNGRADALIDERFGPFVFGLALVLESGRLNLVVRRWSAFGLPMPRVFAPSGDTFEFADEKGRFNFHVEIKLTGAGLLVRYQGYLEPK